MKYIEELAAGETFIYQTSYYMMTTDFKNSGDMLCYNLSDGFPKWFTSNTSVNIEPIYILDENQNLLSLYTYTKEKD